MSKNFKFHNTVFLLWLEKGLDHFMSCQWSSQDVAKEYKKGTSTQNVMKHLQWRQGAREGAIAESTSVFWLKMSVLIATNMVGNCPVVSLQHYKNTETQTWTVVNGLAAFSPPTPQPRQIG